MNLKKAFALIIAGSLFVMTGCSLGNTGALKENNVKSAPEEEIKEETIDPIKEQLKGMTLDEKIGQMIMAGIDGTSLNENDKSLIHDYHIGGVILFSRNIDNVTQTINLNNSIKKENSQNKLPIFISVDEEGGTVSRMPKEFKKIPSAKVVAGKNDENFVYDISKVIGQEVSSLGINMDYAPVLDIYSNPNNKVIGSRAFGCDSDTVSRMGISAMEGIKSMDIIPVVKHFPGHGDTSMDSHVNLPIVYKDKSQLENFEFVPFKNAIDKGCDVVMVSHIILNKIDADNPASFSKAVITDILRGDMNFNGVVITDDMTMGAITENYSLAASSVNSIKAGADIVMICSGYDSIKETAAAIKKSVIEDKSISEERIDESVYRIISLKDKYKLKDNETSFPNVGKINENINSLLGRLNNN